mmetsp:Transcript_59037/g.138115  ORF Transcript_59037/g.138115 Transcript_59037/m.138115 type:complete len:232 (+) Transcript_59037:528-1223(+)
MQITFVAFGPRRREKDGHLAGRALVQEPIRHFDAEGCGGLAEQLGGSVAHVAHQHSALALVANHALVAEVYHIREVQEGGATRSPDWNTELFSFSDDFEVVGVVYPSVWLEPHYVGDLHAWSHLVSATVRRCYGATLGYTPAGQKLEIWAVRRADLHPPCDIVHVPQRDRGLVSLEALELDEADDGRMHAKKWHVDRHHRRGVVREPGDVVKPGDLGLHEAVLNQVELLLF